MGGAKLNPNRRRRNLPCGQHGGRKDRYRHRHSRTYLFRPFHGLAS